MGPGTSLDIPRRAKAPFWFTSGTSTRDVSTECLVLIAQSDSRSRSSECVGHLGARSRKPGTAIRRFQYAKRQYRTVTSVLAAVPPYRNFSTGTELKFQYLQQCTAIPQFQSWRTLCRTAISELAAISSSCAKAVAR
eukprot:1762809-Rhodomonas_salina.7